MPGPYIHISSMLRTARELADGYRPPRSKRIHPDWAGTNRKQLAAILKTHSNFASRGAIGPDLFFFLPDFRDKNGIPISSVLVFVLDFLRKLYSALDPYLSKWQRYFIRPSTNVGA